MGTAYYPSVVSNGLAMCWDTFNPRSTLSQVNRFAYTNDIFTWLSPGGYTNWSDWTLSRDTISSPVGNTPLKGVITGNDPYTWSMGGSYWSIAPAANGQRWRLRLWAKGDRNTMVMAYIQAHDSAHDMNWADALYTNKVWDITTDWREYELSLVMNKAWVAYVGCRLDGPKNWHPNYAVGTTVWIDGLRLEQVSDSITDISGNGNNASGNGEFVYPDGIHVSSHSPMWYTSTTSVLNNDNHSIFFMMRFNGTPTYPNAHSANWDKIFSYNAGGSDRSPGIWRYPNARKIHWRYDPGNSGIDFSVAYAANVYPISGNEFDLGKWYYIGVTKSGASGVGYVNGVNVGTATLPNPKTAGTSDVRLYEYFTHENLNRVSSMMNINCLAIYNRALTAAEVAQNFNTLRPRFGI